MFIKTFELCRLFEMYLFPFIQAYDYKQKKALHIDTGTLSSHGAHTKVLEKMF